MERKRKDRDDEDEKEERVKEEEKPAKKESKKSGECPSGYEFGVDCDKKDECKKCSKWEDCDEAAYSKKKDK